MNKTILFSIIGAITALIVSQISIHSGIKNIELALLVCCFLVTSFTLVLDKISHSTMIKFISLLGIILASITVYHFFQEYQSIRRIEGIFIIALIQISVICTAFFQSWKTNKPHYVYKDLFENAWNNHFFYLFSGLLMGAFLLILGLGSKLFDMLGIPASDFIWNQHVTPIIIGALLGAGIGISREYSQLIYKFRSLFFALFRILAYLTAAIVILFVCVLPFTIDTLFADKNTSIILLSVVAISIVLLNALEDTETEQLPTWANRIFTFQILLLPILVIVSLYAIHLRIEQYGLMPNRIIALWAAMLIGAHVLGYFILLLLNKGNWKLGFARINPPLAFVWVISIILLASPLLDPIKLSANDQVSRLKNDQVEPDKFDFYTLKLRLGKPGLKGIEEIQNWNDHPQISLIKKRIKENKSPRSAINFTFTVVGEAPKNLKELKRKYKKWRCNESKPCFLRKMVLNPDDSNLQPMVFTFRSTNNKKYQLVTDYYEYQKGWKKVKTHRSEQFNRDRMKSIIESIKVEELKPVKPKFPDFEIGGIQLNQ